ncbi:CobW family GTP-binding protein [Halalkalibacter alkaliphilus]|uniref:GTP-binding protein n=1 Tax=Halalkalibacter alkaliphilus TaxID=2917993 RepID=A0A9X2I8I2_9BACI|nr:GTP-binding protein [Halalkalibacter alkaliphilus]MCL7749977.1 GTP-binding protein [Halalkalibacter alkaliphilus]
MSNRYKTPITVVTGCLGSGKTTLLRKLLQKPELKNSAVIVNEFGKVGLDHHLLKKTDEKTILLKGGCICCNNREDLEKELKSLLSLEHSKTSDFDRVIIETTGMADPAPILFTVLTNPLLQHHFYIDCVITTVDAKNGKIHLQNNPELVKQVTIADKIVLTKTDITSNLEKESLIKELKKINPSTEMVEAIHGSNANVDIIKGNNKVVSIRTDDLSKLAENKSHYSSNINSISFTFNKPLDWTAFGLWLSSLLHANGEKIMRVKGLLDVGESGPIVLNGVQHIIHPPDHLNKWPEENKQSHLIFILREIEPNSIFDSLNTFQNFLGTNFELLELNIAL